MINFLNEKFASAYQPERCVSLDETIVPWTVRLCFKQYMPMKPVKSGIKLYQLCESNTGYSYKFKVYAGKEGDDIVRNHTINIVMELMQPLLNFGYSLRVDNFYSSIPLFKKLRS